MFINEYFNLKFGYRVHRSFVQYFVSILGNALFTTKNMTKRNFEFAPNEAPNNGFPVLVKHRFVTLLLTHP